MGFADNSKPTVQIVAKFARRRNSAASTDFYVCDVVADTCEGIPADVLYRNRLKDGRCEFTCVGTMLPTMKSVDVRYYGQWKESKYGTQFRAGSFEVLEPESADGLVVFLASIVKGLGSTTAARIVDFIGADRLFYVIENNPNELMKVPGVKEARRDAIVSGYAVHRGMRDIIAFLGKFGIVSEKAGAVYQSFGDEAVEVMKNNPYAIMDVEGFGFVTADRMARALGVMLTSDVRIFACIRAVLDSEKGKFGHLYVPYAILRDRCMKNLNEGFNIPVVTEQIFESAFARKRASKDLVVRGTDKVFSRFNDKVERDLAVNITKMLSTPLANDNENMSEIALANWQDKNKGLVLSETQRKAVLLALNNRVSIITGGPGTGKTTILTTVLTLFQALNPNAPVTLLAPTGRASRRMAESTGHPAQTIHKALGLYKGEDDDTPSILALPEGLVVVDEVSMMDAFVANSLFSKITSGSQVVLVGDADQLPSVGAGNVLHELIRSQEVPTVKLDRIYRQGTESPIVTNAHKINGGESNLVYTDDFRFIRAYKDDDVQEKILNMYAYEVQKHGAQNVVILCPVRQRYQIGVERLNGVLQNTINPQISGEASVLLNGNMFRQRDRVIQTKNNEFASNGDVGILTKIDMETKDDGTEVQMFTIEFENGTVVEYDKTEMKNVDLAYALTIHKSQGSEYKAVIIPVMSSQDFMLHRNLLYTGITRAREEVVLIGDEQAVATCAKRCDNTKRNTLLGDRIHEFVSKVARKGTRNPIEEGAA